MQSYQVRLHRLHGGSAEVLRAQPQPVRDSEEAGAEVLQWQPQLNCECHYPRNGTGDLRKGDQLRVAASDAAHQLLAGRPHPRRRSRVNGGTPVLSLLACPSLQAGSTNSAAPIRVRHLPKIFHEPPTWKVWRGGRRQRRRLLRHSRYCRRRHCQLSSCVQQTAGRQTRRRALPAAGLRLKRGPCAAAQLRGVHGLKSHPGDIGRRVVVLPSTDLRCCGKAVRSPPLHLAHCCGGDQDSCCSLHGVEALKMIEFAVCAERALRLSCGQIQLIKCGACTLVMPCPQVATGRKPSVSRSRPVRHATKPSSGFGVLCEGDAENSGRTSALSRKPNEK